VKDDEDLTIYGFQNDGNKKQVLLKSRDGVSGTDSYEATDDDSLVPKSYVDSMAGLPISSADKTVTLDSPSANTFTVSTGGKTQLTVGSDGSSEFAGTILCNNLLSTVDTNPAGIQLTSNLVFQVEKLTRFNASGTTIVEVNGEDKSVGINTVASDKAGLTVKTSVGNPTYGTQGVWSNGSVSPTTQAGRFFDSFLSQPIIAAASACEVNHFRAYDNATSTTTGSHAGFVAGNLKAGTTKNYGFWSQVALEDGKTNYAFYASSTAPSYFNGDVITSTIRAKDGAKGVIVLNENLLLDGQTVTVEVGPPDGGKRIEVGSNTTSVAGGNGIYVSSQLNDLSFSSNEIRFNSSWSAGANEPTWVMTEDSGFVGNNNFNYIKCGSISGTISNDAAIAIGADLSVSTDGQFVVRSSSVGQGGTDRYLPTSPSSVVLKQDLDDKIQVMTQAEYDAIPLKSETTLYCITD
ncbi:MAG: phage upper tail fiber protein, partial [Pirellulales bacterium]